MHRKRHFRTNWSHRLRSLLIKMGEFTKAEEIYRILLESCSDEDNKELSDIYNYFGMMKTGQGHFNEALSFYQKSLQIQQEFLPTDHSHLVDIYNNISLLYVEMSNYSTAISFQEQLLEILRKHLPLQHLTLARSVNNLGKIYVSMRD
jgi:tetratricopeptide (TPR) repeat protein